MEKRAELAREGIDVRDFAEEEEEEEAISRAGVEGSCRAADGDQALRDEGGEDEQGKRVRTSLDGKLEDDENEAKRLKQD